MGADSLFVLGVAFAVTAAISILRRHYTEFSVLSFLAILSAFAFLYRLSGGR